MAITRNIDFWRRCTPAEAGTIENSLLHMPVKLRRIWVEGGGIDSTAPEYAEFLRHVAYGGIGEARAAQLLAPSE